MDLDQRPYGGNIVPFRCVHRAASRTRRLNVRQGLCPRSRLMTRLHLVLPAVLLTLAAPPASAQIWTDLAGDGNWNNASNWAPSGIPNSANAAPIFSNEGGSVINISSSVEAGSL